MATLLEQTLELGNLRRAWNDIAENNGKAGVDNVTVQAWRRNWEERLVALAQEVRGNQYKPDQLRERRIPKANGREMRLLRIPTVRDRILQRAALQRLHPVCDPLFLACSFGYRPGRGVRDAVRQINHLRRQGLTQVLDADIDDFFNSVDHDLLAEFLREDLPDDSLLPLIEQWITVDCLTPACDRGIPMGAPVSPLLANVFLHRLDLALTFAGHPPVRYADDFIVLARSEEALRAC
jgi:group II intron reverse transcriptase/maturase